MNEDQKQEQEAKDLGIALNVKHDNKGNSAIKNLQLLPVDRLIEDKVLPAGLCVEDLFKNASVLNYDTELTSAQADKILSDVCSVRYNQDHAKDTYPGLNNLLQSNSFAKKTSIELWQSELVAYGIKNNMSNHHDGLNQFIKMTIDLKRMDDNFIKNLVTNSRSWQSTSVDQLVEHPEFQEIFITYFKKISLYDFEIHMPQLHPSLTELLIQSAPDSFQAVIDKYSKESKKISVLMKHTNNDYAAFMLKQSDIAKNVIATLEANLLSNTVDALKINDATVELIKITSIENNNIIPKMQQFLSVDRLDNLPANNLQRVITKTNKNIFNLFNDANFIKNLLSWYVGKLTDHKSIISFIEALISEDNDFLLNVALDGVVDLNNIEKPAMLFKHAAHTTGSNALETLIHYLPKIDAALENLTQKDSLKTVIREIFENAVINNDVVNIAMIIQKISKDYFDEEMHYTIDTSSFSCLVPNDRKDSKVAKAVMKTCPEEEFDLTSLRDNPILYYEKMSNIINKDSQPICLNLGDFLKLDHHDSTTQTTPATEPITTPQPNSTPAQNFPTKPAITTNKDVIEIGVAAIAALYDICKLVPVVAFSQAAFAGDYLGYQKISGNSAHENIAAQQKKYIFTFLIEGVLDAVALFANSKYEETVYFAKGSAALLCGYTLLGAAGRDPLVKTDLINYGVASLTYAAAHYVYDKCFETTTIGDINQQAE